MSSETDPPIDSEIEAALAGVDLQALDGAGPAGREAREGGGRALRRGTVVGLDASDVFVELGPREQGVISRAEFDAPPEVGAVLEFSVRGEEDGLLLLSRREAKELAAWDELEVGSLVQARVTGVNTGGLELKVGPLSAFMPASHVGLVREEDLGRHLGQTLLCQALEIDRGRKRVVLSRRAVLEAERDQARADAADALTVGGVVRGKVTRIEKFGAFVEIAKGLEGLVHVSNVSRKRVEDLEELLKVGQEVEALVTEIKEGGRRIGLSMKALEPDPWDEVPHRYHEGTVLEGRVVRVADFGAFVELEPGVDGLVHVSQLSRDRVGRVQEVAKVGDAFPVRVLSVDPHARRISLSRMDEHGALLGTEEAADAGAVREVIQGSQQQSAGLGTNLGDLFRKALQGGDEG
jgi:small subunit ribosomal protein S1